ncbi:hypothetical protein J7T55_002327 [Diaporthe amygdali]|uniref:uncharacterized protein n=1 Tax=Phomopsis amygdali TaxID=1214568 RepID=UPI0022FF2C00|nr:uncharacterized protein J7T55_002327 [Diaporthe amygdali]KAJ0109135.1 hypothetical protein J7T55_002327 [Diaporthe amygdali]
MATEEEVKIKSKDSKKDKKDKKRSESDGVHKSKKDKKEKKADKEKLKAKVAEALDNQLQADVAASVKADDDDDDHPGSDVDDIKNPEVKTQLVYFAVPLADVKGHKKIYKTIKKARKAGALQRGVKEVNKALRKTPIKAPANADQVPGICIIAGDISPDEVIMHLPIYCEEHNVPYLFVKSRLELGSAAKTKRPTSVVFIQEKGKEGKAGKAGAAEDDDEDDGASYADAYKELLKLAQKEAAKQLKDVLSG